MPVSPAGGRKSELKARGSRVRWEPPPVLTSGSSLGSLLRGLPSWGLHPHDLTTSPRSHLPKSHLPIPSPWGLGFQHVNWGDTSIQLYIAATSPKCCLGRTGLCGSIVTLSVSGIAVPSANGVWGLDPAEVVLVGDVRAAVSSWPQSLLVGLAFLGL